MPFSTVAAYKGPLSVTYPYRKVYGHYVSVFSVRPSVPAADKHSPRRSARERSGGARLRWPAREGEGCSRPRQPACESDEARERRGAPGHCPCRLQVGACSHGGGSTAHVSPPARSGTASSVIGVPVRATAAAAAGSRRRSSGRAGEEHARASTCNPSMAG